MARLNLQQRAYPKGFRRGHAEARRGLNDITGRLEAMR
jgi:hypothetical protein